MNHFIVTLYLSLTLPNGTVVEATKEIVIPTVSREVCNTTVEKGRKEIKRRAEIDGYTDVEVTGTCDRPPITEPVYEYDNLS